MSYSHLLHGPFTLIFPQTTLPLSYHLTHLAYVFLSRFPDRSKEQTGSVSLLSLTAGLPLTPHYSPSDDIDTLESDIVKAIHSAATSHSKQV